MKLLALLLFIVPPCTLFAQDPKIKFGKITPQELQNKVYTIDSNAHAVVLSDAGNSQIVGNLKGWFSLQFQRHSRIHILNKNGYDEANVEIPLYSNGTATEELENLKAITYNLENGAVVETKLEKSAIFTEKRSRNLVVKKFTLPNVKEGSVIEYSYSIKSDFLTNLQPWAFQGSIPVEWSEYTLSVPQFFEYVFLSQGYQSFFIRNKKDRTQNFTVLNSGTASATERFSFTSGVSDYRWAMQSVPALKPESFTSSVDNYIARIDFQLAALKDPLPYQQIMANWPAVTKGLLEDEEFGKFVYTNNNWLDDPLKLMVSNSKSATEKAQAIYQYLRDNITCTNTYGIYASQHLKNVLKSKNGKAADINLLLAAMLNHEGIEAEPVILSTKEHGFTNSMYPILSRFNYIIVKANIDGKTIYLDATHPQLGFGKLLPECYNGHARVVNKDAYAIDLQPDSLKERKVSAVFIRNNEKGQWTGSMNQTMGYNESYNTRNQIAKDGKEAYWKGIQKIYGNDLSILQPTVDSLTMLDLPLSLRYGFDISAQDEDLIYFNPMLAEGYKENPFKSAERFYPVEMPYTTDEIFVATLEVPKGYVVDELPKSIKVKLNEEGEGYFEYVIAQSDDKISLRSRIKLDRTTFVSEEYETLREFFNLIVTKQKEQIVFKKKK